ncbi:MAG TPA: BamA/TamA family outer membrane protein [Puia sp.]|nr:BamA/TamA family outer membrane protein [Puia sp.]
MISPVWMLLILCLSVASCVVAPKKKQYPSRKPFVFKTTIKLESNLSHSQKLELTDRLRNQLDDSLQVRTTTDLRWKPPFLYRKIVTPPVLDSGNVSRSLIFMNALLNSLGYFEPTVKDSIRIDTIKDQYRAYINFRVRPGKNLKIDSIGFELQTPALQALAIQSKDQSLLKKGTPYSKLLLANEIGRLVDTFRNNGYLRFNKDDLVIEHDTVVFGLIDPSLDPFQQAILLERLKRERENPTIKLVVRQRPIRDSTHLIKYYIGKVTVYPDLPVTEDTSQEVRYDTTVIRNITFITQTNKFKLPFVFKNIYLRPGRLYKQENYYRTFNRFSQLSAWQYSNIDFDTSPLSDTLIDITMRMYPAKKQSTNVSLEASYNTNDIVTASNLFGVGVNFGLQNRNSFKQSIRSSTNLRTGVEFGDNFIQTSQIGISHTIAFPNLIVPFNISREGRLKNVQTLLGVNASYTDRRKFYTLRSINGSWGYQYTKNNKTYLFRIPNIEFTSLDKQDSLKALLLQNPALNYAFRTGFIIGSQFVYSSITTHKNKTNRFRFSAEQSGALLGFIPAFREGDLLRFVKGDVEYVHNINYGKTQLVMRGFAGGGIAYGGQEPGVQQTLPFYKAFWAGGPNSMRAWQVRQLGLGSSKYFDTSSYQGFDRFGDVQLEGNIEFRFPIATLFGYKITSALYTDVGNIWSRKPIDTTAAAQGSDFQINRFYKEFAVGAGTGLRLDFNYFLIRLDWAYKLLDPQRKEDPDRWFYGLTLGSGQFQLGINYPF